MNAEKYILRAYGGEYNERRGVMDTSDDDGQVGFFIEHHKAIGNEVHVYGLIQVHYPTQHIESQPKREFFAMWYGKFSLHHILLDIGGWHVGCENAVEAAGAVELVIHNGWVTHRKHYARAYPEGVDAYEVTDTGLDKIVEWGGDPKEPIKMREWYRANSATPLNERKT